jgi:F-type H+-transporting ATPase subunit epsilon
LLQLHIISPTGEVFSGSVAKVLLPGAKAPFVVLPMHAPLISSLTKGVVRYTNEVGEEHSIEVGGGFVEVKGDVVRVCTE